MARRKKQDILDRMIDGFSLRGFLLHQATLFVAASAILVGGVILLWQNHRSSIVDPEAYRLTEQNLVISPPPIWADEDLKEIILDPDAGDEPSLLDPELVSRTALRVQQIGFVEQVKQISKSKAGLNVDVTYRLPIATMEISKVTIPELPASQPAVLLPIDRQGVLLPKDLVLGPGLPQICVLYPAGLQPGGVNELSTWSDLNDARIRQGCRIAEILAGRCERLGVLRILSKHLPDDNEQSPSFELWSSVNRAGTVVIWGSAPGEERSDEATAEQKINALEAYVQQYGSLTRPAARTIDLRNGHAEELPQNKTADNNDALTL